MFRHSFLPTAGVLVALAALTSGCGSETKAAAAAAVPEPAMVTTAAVESLPIERHLRVTGSLLADEQAEVSAELAGRVTATPIERGTRVPAGAVLVRHLRRRDFGAAAGSRGERRTDRGAPRARGRADVRPQDVCPK